ncbi:DUF4864 domain-containing protein [Pseudooceanicola aestuarii]|uniref:DUF4864 domain-containing protein n=1 Tax=Pseudooceanicola aestuarii TaxID=2697319 RepID=UPI0013D2125A|nr:DUF4864 domain-containing protein [Pseudooceanicola aestuarii]
MKHLLLATLTALTLSGPGAAQDRAIERLISEQFQEFRADDPAGAFALASPMIQGMFQTPEAFARMVEQGYPMVWRPSDWTFLDLRQEGDRLVQRVLITDAQNVAHLLDYRMVQIDMGWKVDGVTLLTRPGVSA